MKNTEATSHTRDAHRGSPRRSRSTRLSIESFLRSRLFLGGLLITSAFALIVLHGVENDAFLVDEITLGLLAFASLPFISSILTSFKAGNIEFAFRDLSVHDQVFTFLDGIATKKQWTFFSPRPGEESIGGAFAILTDDLVKNARSRVVGQVRSWLASDDINQRWFAAEIVGYHRLSELRRAVLRAPETQDYNERWESWELNCLWAASCLDEPPYRGLMDFLTTTENIENQAWILKSFDQLIEADRSPPAPLVSAAADHVERLLKRGVSPTVIGGMFADLRHLEKVAPHITSVRNTSG